MMTVNISEFRANLLKYLEKAKSGETLAITSHGEVLATVSPPVNKAAAAKKRLRRLAKTATLGDVVAPVDADWDALR